MPQLSKGLQKTGITILILALSPVMAVARARGVALGVSGPNVFHKAQDASDALLELQKVVEGEVSPGQVQSYRIKLTAGQLVRLVVEHWGADLYLKFLANDERTHYELSCRQNGITPISLLAPTSEIYRLELRVRTGDSVGGRYRLKIKEIKQATVDDRKRLAAEKMFSQADGLRAEEQAESSVQAIKKYEEAAILWRSLSDKAEEAVALKSSGEVYQALGNSNKAFDYYHQALALSQKANDFSGEAEILNNIGYLQFFLGDMETAFENSSRALDLSQREGNRRVEALALNTIGEAYFGFAEFQKDIEAQEHSIKISRELNNRKVEAQSLVSLGYAYAHLSEVDKALNCYTEAVSLWRAVNSKRGQALTFIALGNLKNNLGEKQEAFDLYQQAQQLLEPTGDLSYKAYVRAHIARSYRDMGEMQQAIENNLEAIELFRTTGNRWGDAEAQLEIGRVYYSSDDNVEAIKHFNQALPIFRDLGMPVLQAQTLRDIGLVYASQGNKPLALDHYRQALRLFRDGLDRRDEAYTLTYIGRVYESSADWPKALDYYKEALTLHSTVGEQLGASSTLYDSARVERFRGNLDAARARIEEALKISESLRSKVASYNLRASFLASTHEQYEFYIDVLMRLHSQHPSMGLDIAAFEASERGRARSLLEALAESRSNIRQGVDSKLLQRERDLQRQLNALTERRIQLAGQRVAGEKLTAIERESAELTMEYQQLQGQIRASSPRYAALVQPLPRSLKEIQQQVLDADSVLLEYALGKERSFLWLLTPTAIKSFELPTRAEVEKTARHVYELLTARNRQVKDETDEQRQARFAESESQYAAASRKLSAMLLGSVAGDLEGKRLVIIADGALQYVPFAALPVPTKATKGESGADTPLIAQHEIISLPSASVLALSREELRDRRPAPKSVAVLADPVFEANDERVRSARMGALGHRDGPAARPVERADVDNSAVTKRAVRDFEGLDGTGIGRLSFSRREAMAIMASVPTGDGLLALDFRASRATAMSSELSQYRIVHFATHGLLNSEQPELSGILLSRFDEHGRSQDGFLQLHDIYNLNLPVDLVVLSACQTALGKDMRGEGLIGLTRGFMYAGASRVVASLWKVDDFATAELMGELYKQMLVKEIRPSEALRVAQIHMLQQTRWRSAYYWAGFTLQGEWR